MSNLISVIIPTHSRPEMLNKCLSSISRGIDSKLHEVIICDTGSPLATNRCYKKWRSVIHNLKYVKCEDQGLHVARHVGVDVAQGNIVAFIDDDIEVGEQWFNAADEAFNNSRTNLLTGPIIPFYESPPPQWISHLFTLHKDSIQTHLIHSLMDCGENRRDIPAHLVYGCNMFIRRKLFYELGGTHPDCYPIQHQYLQGDGETALTNKYKSMGYRADYHPLVKVHHTITKYRLSINFCYIRGVYLGIAASFSAIRQFYGPKNKGFICNSPKHLHSTGWIGFSGNTFSDGSLRLALNEFKRGYIDGWEYHQSCFDKNTCLQRWVLQSDYLGRNALPSSELMCITSFR